MINILTSVIVILYQLQECVPINICPEESMNLDVGACTASTRISVNITYINTGTAPKFGESRCQCEINPYKRNTKLDFQLKSDADRSSHIIEINRVNYSYTMPQGYIVINGRIDILIWTDGYGGVCFVVKADKPLNVSCVQNTNQTTNPSAVIFTTPVSNKTATSELRITKMAADSHELENSTMSKSNTTGPVAGAVGGFLFLVAVSVIAIICIRRRKTRKNENTNNSEMQNKINFMKSEDHYQDMTENPMYDRSQPDNFEMQMSFHGSKLETVSENAKHEHEHEHQTGALILPGSGTYIPVYSTVTPRVKYKTNYHETLDNVYDQTSKPSKPIADDDYDHFGEQNTKHTEVANNTYNRATKKENFYNDKNVHSTNDIASH